MASKYLQKYPVPQDFQQVLHDFGREILRAQPEDIIQFAVDYFEFKVENPDKDFPQNPEHQKFNIARKQVPKEYNKKPYDQLQGNLQRKEDSERPESQHSQQQQYQQNNTSQKPQSSASQRSQNRPQSTEERQVDTSKISGGSQTTHPEEKHITREFMGDLYSQAVQQTVNDGGAGPQNNTTNSMNETSHFEEKQEAKTYTNEIYNEAINKVSDQQSEQKLVPQGGEEGEEFQYEGPVEEYEKAAVMIQKKYREKQKQ